MRKATHHRGHLACVRRQPRRINYCDSSLIIVIMLPPVPALADYGISPDHGFLPPEPPLDVLPDPFYARWEWIVSNLQSLLLSRRIRDVVDQMPILSTSYLQSEGEWRRAYVVLGFILHGYVWGGSKPSEVSHAHSFFVRLILILAREYLLKSPSPCWRFAST